MCGAEEFLLLSSGALNNVLLLTLTGCSNVAVWIGERVICDSPKTTKVIQKTSGQE